MADREHRRVTEHEIREAEIQMTGRPPASATGFIGFVPAAPNGKPEGGHDAASGSHGTADGTGDAKEK